VAAIILGDRTVVLEAVSKESFGFIDATFKICPALFQNAPKKQSHQVKFLFGGINVHYCKIIFY
jgi:hypothetical protein